MESLVPPEQLGLTFYAPLVPKGVETMWNYFVAPCLGGPFPHLPQGWSCPG